MLLRSLLLRLPTEVVLRRPRGHLAVALQEPLLGARGVDLLLVPGIIIIVRKKQTHERKSLVQPLSSLLASQQLLQ